VLEKIAELLAELLEKVKGLAINELVKKKSGLAVSERKQVSRLGSD
jgi:hypothetical protein